MIEELCCLCGEPTAGSDDSIYCEVQIAFDRFEPGDEVGPLCPDCYHKLRFTNL